MSTALPEHKHIHHHVTSSSFCSSSPDRSQRLKPSHIPGTSLDGLRKSHWMPRPSIGSSISRTWRSRTDQTIGYADASLISMHLTLLTIKRGAGYIWPGGKSASRLQLHPTTSNLRDRSTFSILSRPSRCALTGRVRLASPHAWRRPAAFRSLARSKSCTFARGRRRGADLRR